MLGAPRGVVFIVLDWDIVVSEFEPQSRYCVHFPTNILEEKYEPTPPHQLCIRYYNYCSSTGIALAFNNPRYAIKQRKQIKPKHIKKVKLVIFVEGD